MEDQTEKSMGGDMETGFALVFFFIGMGDGVLPLILLLKDKVIFRVSSGKASEG